MKTDPIEFISSYCDRWCERCAYTARCSTFAAEAAIGMCGDVLEGLELAFGEPPPDDPGPPARPLSAVSPVVTSAPASVEREPVEQSKTARGGRFDETPIMQVAWTVTMMSHGWFGSRAAVITAGRDPVLQDALHVARHDASFIASKLHRAIAGRDRYLSGDSLSGDDHPVQNDWNGSAKVALISIERSEAAWRLIGEGTGEETPTVLADQLRDLRVQVERVFPDAWRFIRPGFDEPGR